MKATLRHYRQSPRKVRLVADAIRGRRVSDALALLSHTPKRAAAPLAKLLRSAAANAGAAPEELFIKAITVDEGFMLKRYLPRAFGRATRINKRTSNINVVLAPLAREKTQSAGVQNTNKTQATPSEASEAVS